MSKLPVKVRTLDGKTTEIEAESDWTVKQLKEAFGKFRGQDFSKVNLHYKAKRLRDEELLSKYNIDPGSFVQANIRSLGGSSVRGSHLPV